MFMTTINTCKKSTTNLWQRTYSHKNKNNPSLQDLPKARHYRVNLEPLLGSVVDIDCQSYIFTPAIVDNKPCLRILLVDGEVVKAPKSRKVDLPIKIQHIWTLVDKEWCIRNNISGSVKLRFRGFIYLYNHNGRKNIGLQTLSVKPIGLK